MTEGSGRLDHGRWEPTLKSESVIGVCSHLSSKRSCYHLQLELLVNQADSTSSAAMEPVALVLSQDHGGST